MNNSLPLRVWMLIITVLLATGPGCTSGAADSSSSSTCTDCSESDTATAADAHGASDVLSNGTEPDGMGASDGTALPDTAAEPTDTTEPADTVAEPTDTAADTTPEDTAAEPTDTTTEPTDTATDSAEPTDVSEDTAEPMDGPCQGTPYEGRWTHGEGSPLAQLDAQCGKLSYGLYANEGQSDAVHILPDFSHAGYMGGGVPLPDVPTVVTLDPAPGDDLARIQAAIDEVSAREPDANGFRGAVLLQRGQWLVSDTIALRASGVVLRGEGQGSDGTVVTATRRAQHVIISLRGGGSRFGEVDGTRVSITDERVPVGSKTLTVESAVGFAVGDTVGVVRTPNSAWIDALEMAQYGWSPEGYTITHERRIVAIEGDQLTLDIPLVDTLEASYGGGEVFKADLSARLEQAGVEDVRLVSEYDNPTDEEHAWSGIELRRVANSWVRRVTVLHVGYAAVTLHDASSFNTIEEVAMLDHVSVITGGRRYSFNISGGVGNLFQRCFAREGRHNFVTGSRVTGPHVWLDCLSVNNHSDEGPHHRWATGLLFDNIYARDIHVQNREDSGSGHGWAGAQVMFWNVVATRNIRSDAPTGAMNWVVGSQGNQAQGSWAPHEPFGLWESHGSRVEPRSLYLQQLEDRLGAQAVAAISTPEQRSGTIWSQLRAWAGEGPLSATVVPIDDDDVVTCDGILASSGGEDVCCRASCGVCGGSGCGSRPGGAANCCSGAILASELSCAEHGAPCVMP